MLGEMIKEKREAKGLSLKSLGKACGISDSEMMKIENGKHFAELQNSWRFIQLNCCMRQAA